MAVTQKKAIFAHLKTAGSITPLEALMRFGCFRLGARIYELKAEGHEITTERITDEHGKTYARYRYRHPATGQQQLFDT